MMRHEKTVFVFALCAALALGAFLLTPAASARPSYCTECYYPGAANFACTCPPGTNHYGLIVTCAEYWGGGCEYFTDSSAEVSLLLDTRFDSGAKATTCVEPAQATTVAQPDPEIAGK